MKYTQGEWYPVDYLGQYYIQSQPYYQENDDLLDADCVGEQQAEANAKLIAAAPDLLEALQWINMKYGDIEGDRELSPTENNMLDKVRKAIKKATT